MHTFCRRCVTQNKMCLHTYGKHCVLCVCGCLAQKTKGVWSTTIGSGTQSRTRRSHTTTLILAHQSLINISHKYIYAINYHFNKHNLALHNIETTQSCRSIENTLSIKPLYIDIIICFVFRLVWLFEKCVFVFNQPVKINIYIFIYSSWM